MADGTRNDDRFPSRTAGTTSNPAALVWLGLIIVLCLGLKFRQNAVPFFTGVDGGLYTNIAEHVRDGRGLVTDISPYHHGYETFPHATAIYPLWPLIYGYASRLVPVRIAGVWIPTLGYLLALIFAYLWASRSGSLGLDRQGGGPQTWPLNSPALPEARRGPSASPFFKKLATGLNPGHALVLFLGLNGMFFTYTSLPYTEGLAYALLFACLWRFHKIGLTGSLASAGEMGVWLALLMLVRSQFLVVALAAFLALALEAGRRRSSRDWGKLSLAIGVFAALMLPWLIHVSRIVSGNPLSSLLRYDQARASNLLGPLEMLVSPATLAGRWKSLLLGLKVAFSPNGESSYFSNFHGLVFALPAFLILLLIGAKAWARSRKAAGGNVPDNAPRFEGPFLVLLSAGAFASLQLMQVDLDLPWLFNQRHATILLVPLFLMWQAAAVSRKRVVPIIAILVAFGTIIPGALDCWNAKTDVAMAAARLKPLERWLVSYEQGRSPAVVAAADSLPQLLSPMVPGVGFHGVYRGTAQQDLRTLFEKAGADLLILEDQQFRGQFFFRQVDPDWFATYFEPAAELPGYVVFRRSGRPGTVRQPRARDGGLVP
jgi:hypothetical protein